MARSTAAAPEASARRLGRANRSRRDGRGGQGRMLTGDGHLVYSPEQSRAALPPRRSRPEDAQMATESPHGGAGDLAARLRQAEATVAEQAREIAGLRGQLADAEFADELRQALVRHDQAGAWVGPAVHNELLEMIVRTAARVMDARAATLYLVDYETDEMVFGVAVGPGSEDIEPFRMPLGVGIAGWAAATGQPVAVSDASQDPRFAAGVAQGMGYVPKSVLCIPLRSGQAVVGVIQLFDKAGGHPFTAVDMELLGQFAS